MSLLAGIFGNQNFKVKNVWNLWIEHIMKHRSRLVLKGASIFRNSGEIAASTKGFIISTQDLESIRSCFDDSNTETIRVQGVTYCIKTRDSEQLVSFNGQTYIIVCKTNSMFIIAKCTSRQRIDIAAQFIKKTAERLKAQKW